MESMPGIHRLPYFDMACEALIGTDDISAFVALRAVGHSFQLCMAAG
jgi:hypothetical protein